MGLPRQEYWSGLSFPSLEDLPDPGIETVSSALAGRFFATEPATRETQTNFDLELSCVGCRTNFGSSVVEGSRAWLWEGACRSRQDSSAS